MPRYLIPLLLALIFPLLVQASGTYQEPEQFISEVFAGNPPQTSMLWITKELKPDIQEILGRDLGVLRLRYWGEPGRTAWILEEIGKEQPITTGIVVDKGKIELIKVLVFRESRGWEVSYPFFTDQFKGASLKQDDELDRSIDGISGATLSTRALTKLARLALYLHQQSEFADAAD
ncbi:MAG: FMN-binding protein [Gammaproteobacteria bacterium]